MPSILKLVDHLNSRLHSSNGFLNVDRDSLLPLGINICNYCLKPHNTAPSTHEAHCLTHHQLSLSDNPQLRSQLAQNISKFITDPLSFDTAFIRNISYSSINSTITPTFKYIPKSPTIKQGISLALNLTSYIILKNIHDYECITSCSAWKVHLLVPGWILHNTTSPTSTTQIDNIIYSRLIPFF